MSERDDRTAARRDAPAPDLPAYAGREDTGVRESGGSASGTAGDVVDLLGAEHARIEGIVDELSGHLDAGDTERAQLRFGGLVRQVLELQAAEGRVVWPAVGDDALRELRQRGEELRGRLGQHDELNASPSPDELRALGEQLRGYVRAEAEQLVPVLRALSADERGRLGEDMRQVMG